MSSVEFDYERLLSLLPRHKLLKPVDLSNANLPKWHWPPLKSYNGFTSNERIYKWQVGTYLFKVGAIRKSNHCEICKRIGPVESHSENYYDFLSGPFLCKSCHTILHLRFRYPNVWYRLLQKSYKDSETWFSILRTSQVDLAGYLRSIGCVYKCFN